MELQGPQNRSFLFLKGEQNRKVSKLTTKKKNNKTTYYKATVMQTLVLAEDKYTDQWDRTKGPEINPHTYGQAIVEGIKDNGDRAVFSTNGAGIVG